MDDDGYHVPKALTILAGIFLVAGAILLVIPLVDITYRRGWRSMMWIMIPVWPINACYLGPLAIYLYFRYGRPSQPSPVGDQSDHHDHMNHKEANLEDQQMSSPEQQMDGMENPYLESGIDHRRHHPGTVDTDQSNAHDASNTTHEMTMESKGHNMHDMHAPSPDVPFWVTVAIGVMHCGAGCVLGDIVGEWLVYGTGANINGEGIWVELLVDYGFALLFGIVFQYFTIGPMSGDYGPKTIIRAIKADFLSLTFFEIGLFGWMVAYQVGIWDYRLMMNTWCYWWMMQVGMLLGAVTAFPVNWFLITRGIKEPCV